METNKRNQRSYSGEHENWDQKQGRQNDYNQSRNTASNYGNNWDNDNNWRDNNYNRDHQSNNRSNQFGDSSGNNPYGESGQRWEQDRGRQDTNDYLRNRRQEGFRHQDADRNDFNSNYQNRNFGNRDYDNGRSFGSNYGDFNDGNNRFSRSNYDEQHRNWLDRTRDEVSSWFGDDEAERRRHEDKQRDGQHRGKGPKDYQRSSDRIREDISDRLSDDPFVDASEIDVKVTGNEVTLTGTVDSKEAKRRAEDIAEAVSGVSNVQNQLRVGQSAQTGSSSYQTKPQTTAAQQKHEKERQN